MTDSVGNNIFLAMSRCLRLTNRVAPLGQNALLVGFLQSSSPSGGINNM
jgi:hypothetical protein